MIRRLASIVAIALASPVAASAAPASEPARPASVRFAADDAAEVPDFQRHVLPMMGRAGCNTRSCHGSFQGRGGFRLSLFGYDFKADRETLIQQDTGRVDLEDPEASKILSKPTLAIPHKGGRRLEADTWQYRLLLRWIEGGARGVEAAQASHFERLEVIPAEVVFDRAGQKTALKVVAHWADGGSEDVTCLTRFRTNDGSIAEVDADGVVTSLGPGDTHVVAFYDNGVTAVPAIRPVSDRSGARYPAVAAPTRVDELVVAKLRKLGIEPSAVCTDAEYLRRVGLDLTGTLPTPAEIEAFLADPSAEKRARKVDELLARPSYAAWWTTKLCDYTGDAAKTLQPQLVGVQAPRRWYEWLGKRVAANRPYDELIAGLVLATGREKGQSYDDYVKIQAASNKAKPDASYADRETLDLFWLRQNFRKPEEKVIGFSYAFLGVRLECAQCHKHPFDQWTQDDFRRFGAFFDKVRVGVAPDAREAFARINRESGLDKLQGGERNKMLYALRAEGKPTPWQEVFVARNGPPAGRVAGANADAKKVGAAPNARVVSAKVLGGEEVSIASLDDPRAPLMAWLRGKDNPYFARAFVNRVWANDFGVGIVDPPDDMNLANPPSNAALLDYLADGFVDHGFDMKWLHREILASQTYQRSWRVNETNRHDERNFSRAVIRRLPAEVLIDAVAQATGNSTMLATASTKLDARAIGPLAGFGRGRQGGNYAARVFGTSTRETNCDCNRSDEPNLLQSIYLQNDAELYAAIDRADGWVAERTGAKGGAAGPAPDLEGVPLAELGRRLEDAKAKDQAPRIRRLEGRIAFVRDRGDGPAAEEPATTPAIAAADRDGVVVEAYLRALGRRPVDDEARSAADYLAGSVDGAKGLRDLLWALLNTKEFATNH